MNITAGFSQKMKRAAVEVPVEIRRIMNGSYPPFVTATFNPRMLGEVPVFMFHTVERGSFQAQLEYLKDNGYRTLTLVEFLDYLKGDLTLKDPAVLLTFDDGEKSLYEVAYPLLKRYGFHAVAFVIPHYMRDSPDLRPGKGWLSWEQLREMDQSGVIDIQSHSYYHALVFTSPELEGFYHPGSALNGLMMDVPWTEVNGEYTNNLPWGAPLYRTSPRLSGRNRYLDDPQVHWECAAWVAARGGARFFQRPDWRAELRQVFRKARKTYWRGDTYETPEALNQQILIELHRSRYALEEQLGKQVKHLCYPWGAGSEIAAELSREAGYESNFWLSLPGKSSNRCGDSPFSITRLKDDYLFRLPGKGRRTLFDIFMLKLVRRAKTVDIY